MPKYSYRVVNQENIQLQGTINAPDEQTARHELNLLSFSIISLNQVADDSVDTTTQPDNIIKFEFTAKDKTGKEVAGTIQGEEIYAVFKRLINEYQFEVHTLFPQNFSEEEKEKAKLTGVDQLRDKYEEEKIAIENLVKKQQIDQAEFAIKQEQLKKLVEFVLVKVNEFLDKYTNDIKIEHKVKIKYFVDKILRIRNSTNLEYIKESCQDLLHYIQEQELFIHTDSHSQDRNLMNLEARNLMIQIRKADKTKPKDLFEDLITWRKNQIVGKTNLPFWLQVIDQFLAIFFGPAETNPEKEEILASIKNLEEQMKTFFIISVQSKERQIRQDAFNTVMRLWQQRKKLKKQLHAIEKNIKQTIIDQQDYTLSEAILLEIYRLAIWIFSIYTIYYFISIFASTKDLPFQNLAKLPLIFQNPIIKYSYVGAFLFICFAGLKIEFFKRNKLSNYPLVSGFLICSLLISFNF